MIPWFHLQGMDEVQQQEWVKKGMHIGEDISKTAKGAAERISKQGEELTKTRAYQTVSQVIQVISIQNFLWLFGRLQLDFFKVLIEKYIYVAV